MAIAERDDVALASHDAGEACGLVAVPIVDIVKVGCQLEGGMNGLATAEIGIVVKHGDDGAELSIDNTSYCADGDIGDRHVIDAAYVDGESGLVGRGYKSYVLTSNTTIGASVYKRTAVS
jgi:hypothetical protein